MIAYKKLHGYVDTLGAATTRMTHSNPNSANISSIKKKKNPLTGEEEILLGFEGRYGYETRELFCSGPDPNYVLLGADAKGLELRVLCHYMNDNEYTEVVIHGDPHIKNMELAGLTTKAEAKTFIYGFLYGAGAAKIGSIIGGRAKEGQELKTRFLTGLPKLAELISRVEKTARIKGMLPGLDGRQIHVRKVFAALNTLLQGNGAIICKYWLIEILKRVAREQLDVKLVASVHDEYQFLVHKDHSVRLEEICHEAIKATEILLRVKVPLECDCTIGKNWAETH